MKHTEKNIKYECTMAMGMGRPNHRYTYLYTYLHFLCLFISFLVFNLGTDSVVHCFTTSPYSYSPSSNKRHGPTALIDSTGTASAGTSLNSYNAKTRSSSSSSYKSKYDDKTELNRTKFLMNQLKGNLQESEMRASAAERRVATLQKDLNAKMEENGTDSDTNENSQGMSDGENGDAARKDTRNRERMEKLSKQVTQLNQSMTKIKTKMENKVEKLKELHGKERTKWTKENEEYKTEIDQTRSELTIALKQVSELNIQNEKLTLEINRLVNEIKNMKELHLEEIMQFKDQATQVENNLREIIVDLENNLLAAKEEVKKERDILEKETIFHQLEIEDRNNQIESLHQERSKIRTLLKLQLSIVKSRVAKRYRKFFSRE
mmetsp:Transcript_16513/g.20185  ORF Transcript_16513/g.20185 Transcript_16513/m.20185 type:complete len:377 (-) Transcript_16513:181-1311(-)